MGASASSAVLAPPTLTCMTARKIRRSRAIRCSSFKLRLRFMPLVTTCVRLCLCVFFYLWDVCVVVGVGRSCPRVALQALPPWPSPTAL